MCGTLMSSCTDYLTIIPPGVITEEHFWQTKDDVNGVMAKAYLNLLSTDAVQKAIIWGELRADNLTYPASYNENIKYIVEANILDENPYTNWAIYYEAIQTANLVIERAPKVMEHDPDFTEGDLQVVTGEMYALRALAHFYLVRSFRDIPMALESVSDDSDMPEYEQVHPLEALNLIMADLEKALPMVMKSGGFTSVASNYGRITENAVLAIMADVNLWRAAFATYYEGQTDLVAAGDAQKYYDLCVQNCQDVLDKMDAKFEEDNEKNNNKNPEKFPHNLLQNEGELEDRTDERISTVYNEIFGNKNSRESILELQVEGANVDNGFARGVANMYGTDGNRGSVVVPANFLGKYYEIDDLRAYSYTNAQSLTGGSSAGSGSSSDATDVIVAKYQAKSSPAGDYRKSGDYDANWIIYRRTDVMLMKAEALAARQSATPEDLAEAFDIVKVINTRSRMDSTDIKKPLNGTNLTKDGVMELVLKERLLELTFEGKRWYDLVRKALREKTTNNIKFVADKLDSNSGVVKSKMSTIDGLFMPIYIDELRYNKLLKQNPAYQDEDETTEMN